MVTSSVWTKSHSSSLYCLYAASGSVTDIYLPIDSRQKALFDSIDGRLTVAEVSSNREVARTLFERLWDYAVAQHVAHRARPPRAA